MNVSSPDLELAIKSHALDACKTGILITDAQQPDNPIIYANCGFERLTGYTQAEVLGKNCRFLQGKETEESVKATLREAIGAGKPFQGVLRNYRKDGTMFWNELSISPVYDPHGKLTHFIGIQTDVTQNVQLEQQLRSEKEKAEMESGRKSKYLSYISHDFQNSLNIIQGYTAILLNTPQQNPLDDKQTTYLEKIQHSALYLSQLVRDLLDIATIESGQMDMRPASIFVMPFMQKVLALYDDLAHQLEVQTTLTVENGLTTVNLDPVRLKQVMTNLISNAIKYNKPGGHMDIKVAEADNTGEVLFIVSDTGRGIPEESIPHLFEEYYRVHSPKNKTEGTGLGLPITKALVEQMGGNIAVHSREGVGTTVVVRLPKHIAGSGLEAATEDNILPVTT